MVTVFLWGYEIGKGVTIWIYLGKFPSPKSSLLILTLQEHKENECSVEEWLFLWNGKKSGTALQDSSRWREYFLLCFGILTGWMSSDYYGPNGNFATVLRFCLDFHISHFVFKIVFEPEAILTYGNISNDILQEMKSYVSRGI